MVDDNNITFITVLGIGCIGWLALCTLNIRFEARIYNKPQTYSFSKLWWNEWVYENVSSLLVMLGFLLPFAWVYAVIRISDLNSMNAYKETFNLSIRYEYERLALSFGLFTILLIIQIASWFAKGWDHVIRRISYK
ncbi:MAG: hypothetical protein ACTSUE_20115, partial [Promethearchaeota archaeon]